MTYTVLSLVDMRKRLRSKLVETGQHVVTVPDEYYADQLRETAYRWGRDNNYIVSVKVEKDPKSNLRKIVTATVEGERT